MNSEDVEAFLSKVDRSKGANACHLWNGRLTRDSFGYGKFKGEGAHRFAWRLKNGPIPDGGVIMHSCDNPRCCNPAHLLLGDHVDNRFDCVSKKRHAKGQTSGQAKLTHRQVRFIRTHHEGWTHEEIAAKYGVSRSTITKIRQGKTYVGVGLSSDELRRTS